jgi:hypothetical protein
MSVHLFSPCVLHTVFWLENLKGTDHSENPCIDGRIILKWILGKWWEGVDWMHLAQDRNQWWAVVNTVMNAGNFLTT